jgi:F0F1-type ATP synthase membrane subunit b/b'
MKTNTERNKKIEGMLAELKKMRKRTEIFLRKVESQLEKEETKYQKELADFERRYGA